MARIITFVVTAGIALVVAAPGLGKVQPVVTDPATEAQILRGQALGREYQLGRSSTSPSDRLEPNVGARGLTDDPASRVGSTIEASSGSELDWAQLVAGLGLGVMLASGLLVAVRFTRARPVGH